MSATPILCEIPIEIYDLTAPSQDEAAIAPGYYYDIPVSDAERSNPAEIFLQGPYPTRGDALDAARAFINDCLANQGSE